MKKRWKIAVLFYCVLALCLLAACGRSENPQVYSVEYNGKVFTVDQVHQTIAVDDYVCYFQVSGGAGNTTFDVTYPNGATYFWTSSGNSGHGGWSDGYDPDRYVPGDVLWDVLSLDRRSENSGSGRYRGPGLLLILLGAVNAAAPRAMWYLSHGWRYNNAEPSEVALFAGRAGGVAAILLGVFCLF